MSTAQPDVGEWLRRLATKAIAEQVHTLRRYGELVRRLTSGELDETRIREEAARFAREESARYAQGLANLGLGYSDAVLDLERARNDAFFDAVLGGSSALAEPAAEPTRVDLTLSGGLGSEVSGSFVMENRQDAPTTVTFAVSDFRSTGPSFRPPLVIEPDGFTLPPNSEQRVRVRLPLVEDLFEVGRFTATVTVRGRDDLEIAVVVEVREPAALEVVTGAVDSKEDAQD